MSEHFVDKLANAYFFVKGYVIKKGYSFEIDYADEIKLINLKESFFLNQAAWVVLSSGMSYKVISNKFNLISDAFDNWVSAKAIVQNKQKCKIKSLKIFNNEQKIDAIIKIASIIEQDGFETIKSDICKNGVEYLTRFPFIGPATKFHLAKNIGINVAKPDRHLVRISNATGYNSPDDLCKVISERISEKAAIIDLVIWRYATLDRNYLMKINHFLKSDFKIV